MINEIDQKIKKIDQSIAVMSAQLEVMEEMIKRMINKSSSSSLHTAKNISKSWTDL